MLKPQEDLSVNRYPDPAATGRLVREPLSRSCSHRKTCPLTVIPILQPQEDLSVNLYSDPPVTERLAREPLFRSCNYRRTCKSTVIPILQPQKDLHVNRYSDPAATERLVSEPLSRSCSYRKTSTERLAREPLFRSCNYRRTCKSTVIPILQPQKDLHVNRYSDPATIEGLENQRDAVVKTLPTTNQSVALHYVVAFRQFEQRDVSVETNTKFNHYSKRIKTYAYEDNKGTI
ncbi:hypothetical protein RRG08_041060 [Elysia crispata]|uniref:Uncharacterized protein n=1 Tax=Elysia crispata TaxID=231223 RepID=A0AAE0Y7M8_9GAST|nr:hypothetical protein RRG08_041060 [Elysia crispata]